MELRVNFRYYAASEELFFGKGNKAISCFLSHGATDPAEAVPHSKILNVVRRFAWCSSSVQRAQRQFTSN